MRSEVPDHSVIDYCINPKCKTKSFESLIKILKLVFHRISIEVIILTVLRKTIHCILPVRDGYHRSMPEEWSAHIVLSESSHDYMYCIFRNIAISTINFHCPNFNSIVSTWASLGENETSPHSTLRIKC